MKHKNITLSIPADLDALLHSKVSRRGISKYVAEAVRKALLADEKNELLRLEAAYKEASQDLERQELISEWSALDPEDMWTWKNE